MNCPLVTRKRRFNEFCAGVHQHPAATCVFNIAALQRPIKIPYVIYLRNCDFLLLADRVCYPRKLFKLAVAGVLGMVCN